MKNSINLLDYKNKIHPKQDHVKHRHLRLIAISLLFLVSSLSMIFFILITLSPLPQLRKQEKIASFNLTQSHPDIIKLALIKERTDKIQELINKRPYYDKTLKTIQEKIPRGVTIDSVEIDKNNFSVTFLSNSLLQIDSFLNEMTKSDETKKEFSRVKIVNLLSGENSTSFLLTINLNTL